MRTTHFIWRDQRGHESMQTVMIMAVGALILLAIGGLFKQVSPKIKSYVQAALGGAAGQSSLAFGGGTSSGSFGNGMQAPSANGSGPNGLTSDVGRTGSDAPNSGLPPMAYELAKYVADFSKDRRALLADQIQLHLDKTLPTEAAFLEGLIDEELVKKANLDPLSDAARQIDARISALRELSHRDLQNLALFLEDKTKMDASVAPFLDSLGRMFNMHQVLDQDAVNQALGRDPNTTVEQAYEAYVSTFQISSSVLADGAVDAITQDRLRPTGSTDMLRNVGIQVAINQAANDAGRAVAEQLFPHFNNISHWMYDRGYTARPPRFPRDWQPPRR